MEKQTDTVRKSAFVGFLASDRGSFYFNIQDHNGKGDFGVYVYPAFSLSRHESNRGLLEEVQDVFGVGTISDNTDKQNLSVYRAAGFDDCHTIRDAIESYQTPIFQYGEKYESFNEWCQIMDEHEGYASKAELRSFIEDVRSLNSDTRFGNGISAEAWMRIIDEYGVAGSA